MTPSPHRPTVPPTTDAHSALHERYKASTVPLQPAEGEAPPSKGFPFALLARWLVSALLVIHGSLRLLDLVGSWRWLADRTVIDPVSSPYFRLVGDACILLTGLLLWRRSVFVFVPLLGHVAIVLWFVFGAGDMRNIPGVAFVAWALQLAVLGFCLWLMLKQRLK